MANVYEGKPDGRQSDDVKAPVSRFRPTYRALTDEEKDLHDALKAKAVELEYLFGRVKPRSLQRAGDNVARTITDVDCQGTHFLREALMDEYEKTEKRMQCLDLAVQVCKQTGNTEEVLPNAEKYWQWLNGSHDAHKTP